MEFNIITITLNAKIVIAILLANIIQFAIVIIALFFDSLRRIYVLYDEMKKLGNEIKELDDLRRIDSELIKDKDKLGGDFVSEKEGEEQFHLDV